MRLKDWSIARQRDSDKRMRRSWKKTEVIVVSSAVTDCVSPFACEDCLKPRETVAAFQQFVSVFFFFVAPPPLTSHAGAMDEYNSIEGLLAPVRDGALRPLSGRYIMKLAAGQRSLTWSPHVLGIDTSPIFDISKFSFVRVGFKCVM